MIFFFQVINWWMATIWFICDIDGGRFLWGFGKIFQCWNLSLKSNDINVLNKKNMLKKICFQQFGSSHDDVIKWKHFPRYWPFVEGIHWSAVNSPHKGQWRGALMFSLNVWVIYSPRWLDDWGVFSNIIWKLANCYLNNSVVNLSAMR